MHNETSGLLFNYYLVYFSIIIYIPEENWAINCFLWFKDTKMKANHNYYALLKVTGITVSYGSKILKWKQITTNTLSEMMGSDCFLWFKDTKMKANHNYGVQGICHSRTVSYGSKILKWKQITTSMGLLSLIKDCFLWFKDTKMKANHNPYTN